MSRNRIDEKEFRRIAEELSISTDEVRKAVRSFFGILITESRSLPLNNSRKIYTKEKFSEFESVLNIPYIGRLGPVYSRYLKWRYNESLYTEQALRSDYRSRITQSDIENMAEDILSGKTPSLPEKKKSSELFNRVWIVGKYGKKSARQVIPKEIEDNVSD